MMTNTDISSTDTKRSTTKGKVSVAQILVYELRVRDAMSKPPVTANPMSTMRDIQLLMKKRRISGVPITEDGNLLGIITIEDIITALDKGHINNTVDRWMSRDIATLRDHFSLVRAVAEFDKYGYGRFPVLDTSGNLVGIITPGDITSCLMHHLEKRAEEAVAKEAALVAALSTDEQAHRVTIKVHVKSGDFDSAGKISQRMREILRARGIDPDVRRRAAIAAYEAETNIIIHSIGGELSVTIHPDKVVMDAMDEGPGIEKIDLALTEGWSTAGPLARELGFGAGMGLPNIKKCSDRFDIKSELGRGTHVRSEIDLRKAGDPS
jgi:CBS domain-containing protein/anti-sigma regulatory factor (Ser/Thr protein kinase)